jgi:hypothetical protein
LITLGASFLSGLAYAYTYVVRPGDTLSEIVQRHLPGRIYGKKGNLLRIVRRNPKITDPNLVRTGDEVTIGRDRALAAVAEATKLAEAAIPESPTPVSTEAASEPDQSFFVVPQVIYTGISAKDKANGGTLRATDGNYGVRFGYAQKWSDRLSLYAVANWYKIDLKSPLSTGTTISKNTYTGFSVGSLHVLSEAWTLGTAFGYQEEPVVTAASVTNLVIDRVGLLEAGLRLSHRLAESETKRFSIWAELGGSLSVPTKTQNYDVDLGHVIYGKLTAHSALSKRTRLEIGPYYRVQTLNTSLVEQRLTSIGLGAQIRWEFGEK